MAKPTWRNRVSHMLDAVSAIEAYTADLRFEDYAANRLVADAVERNLERVSEASRHVPDEVKAQFQEVPWRQVADIGNVLRHAYDGVSDRRVFLTVRSDLPVLKSVLERLLSEHEAENR